jgi:transcriptional regulator GlxA family with amidase domain
MLKWSTRGKRAARVVALGAALLAVGGVVYRFAPALAQDQGTTEATKKYTRNVAIVVNEGAELLDFAGPAEVFSAAASQGVDRGQPAFKIYTVGVSREPITSLGFVKITPEFTIDDAPTPDILVIPGGGTGVLLKNEKFMAWATSTAKEAPILLTVCTGAFVPAQAGLLDGLDVTTWYNAIDRLKKAAPKANVQNGRRFVDNGRIITTAGVSAGIDGALHTVARLLGRHVADKTAQYMEYHWTPESYLAQRYSYLNPSLDEHGRELQQATIHEDAQDFPQAEKAFRALIERDPNDAAAWYHLGIALHVQGKLDAAIDANKRATASAAMRSGAYYNLACAYTAQGKLEEATNSLKQAVAAGFKDKAQIASDPDLENLRSDDRFKQWFETLP